MVAAGFAWFLTSLTAANGSIPYTIGTIVENLPFAVIIHVLLAYPRGRLEWWVTRAVVASAYVTVGIQFLSLLFHEPTVSECPRCPANALLDGRPTTWPGSLGRSAGSPPWCSPGRRGHLRAAVARGSTASRHARPVLATGGLAAFLLALSFLLDFVVSDFVVDALFVLSAVVLSTVPLASLAGLLQSQLARSAVGSLIVELGQSLPQASCATRARALGDPSSQSGTGCPRQVFVDHEGRPLPRTEGSVTRRGGAGRRADRGARPRRVSSRTHLIDAVVAAAGHGARRAAARGPRTLGDPKPGPARRHAGRHVQDRPRRHLPRLQGRGRAGLFMDPDSLIGKNVRETSCRGRSPAR